MSDKLPKIHIIYVAIIMLFMAIVYIQHTNHAKNKRELRAGIEKIQDQMEDAQAETNHLKSQLKKLNEAKDTGDFKVKYDGLQTQFEILRTENELLKMELKQLRGPTALDDDDDDDDSHPIQELNRRLKEQKELKKLIANTPADVTATTEAPITNQSEPTKPSAESEPVVPLIEPSIPETPESIIEEEAVDDASATTEASPIESTPIEAVEDAGTVEAPTDNTATQDESPSQKPSPESPVTESNDSQAVEDAQPDADDNEQSVEPATSSTAKDPAESQDNLADGNTQASEEARTDAKGYQCPSADVINKHLQVGQFNTDEVVWWLDFSFRPLNLNEEVKSPTKILFDGNFVDCYYPVGLIGSEDVIQGIWMVYKGSVKDFDVTTENGWENCDMEGCLKSCNFSNSSSCTFYLEKK